MWELIVNQFSVSQGGFSQSWAFWAIASNIIWASLSIVKSRKTK